MNPMLLAALAPMMQQFGQSMNTGGYALGQGDVGGALSQFGQYNPVVGALGGFLSGRKAKKKERSMKRKIEQARKKTESIYGRGMAQQEALSREGTRQTLAGYDIARKEASRLGRASKQGVLDTEKQLGARLSQGLTERGLGSTTLGGNLQRGLASDTARQLQGINQGLAGTFGDLALGRAGAEAAGTQSLADLAAEGTNFGIQNAQFWMPQNLSRLGQMQGMRLGGGQMGGMMPTGGFDMNALAQIFGLGGGGGMNMMGRMPPSSMNLQTFTGG